MLFSELAHTGRGSSEWVGARQCVNIRPQLDRSSPESVSCTRDMSLRFRHGRGYRQERPDDRLSACPFERM